MNLFFNKNLLNLAKRVAIFSLVLAVLGAVLVPLTSSLAQIQEPLVISNVNITKANNTATISWNTNRPATGRVDYGLQPGNYPFSVSTNQKVTNQAITIFGLNENTDYYFRITASDNFAEVQSFEQNFETGDIADNKAPLISNVRVVYLTGTTATIQWETDEEATSEIEYGQTTAYGRTVKDSRRVRQHDITINNLITGAFYHFRVKSTDKDNNTSRWFDMTFRTNITNKAENTELDIFDVQPASNNDIKITETTAVISFRTNKLTQGWVRYGTSPNSGKTIATNPPRDFQHSLTLTGLAPGTTYYFDIKVRDVFGKEKQSNGFSFTTKSSAGSPTTPPVVFNNNQGSILGATTCNVNLNTEFGYYGSYYNLPQSHPDMETWQQNVGIADENDWYDNQYFVFSRTDTDLKFGSNFYPIQNNLPGDPNHFAVYWRAIVNVPTTGTYTYKIKSDDDSWVFIDGNLTTDLKGIHTAKETTGTATLNAGWHTLEIYYADRQRTQAVMSFTPDNKWRVHPLPAGCSLQDVLNNAGSSANTSGVVLGSSNINDGATGNGINFDSGNGAATVQTQTYACNPNLGYSKITNLYKTSASPDVWAILETGQKYYITSPESFALYQCDWSKIKTVSQSFLDRFSNANLVRTPDNPTIYHLFDRLIVKWLKINIPSPTIFVSYPANYWGNVVRINRLDLASYPDARLIKGENSPTIYLIEGRTKKPFISEEQFIDKGHNFVEVVTLNQAHLDSYKTVAPVQ